MTQEKNIKFYYKSEVMMKNYNMNNQHQNHYQKIYCTVYSEKNHFENDDQCCFISPPPKGRSMYNLYTWTRHSSQRCTIRVLPTVGLLWYTLNIGFSHPLQHQISPLFLHENSILIPFFLNIPEKSFLNMVSFF